MRSSFLLIALGIAAVAASLFPDRAEARTAPSTEGFRSVEPLRSTPLLQPAPPAPPAAGHLLLQVEGDATALAVTWVTAKPDPYRRPPQETPYRILLANAAGQTLGSYPLDLSAFDLDPARLGKGVEVAGCLVRDARVATIAKVPHLPEACSVVIVAGDRPLGGLAAADYARMVPPAEAAAGAEEAEGR